MTTPAWGMVGIFILSSITRNRTSSAIVAYTHLNPASSYEVFFGCLSTFFFVFCSCFLSFCFLLLLLSFLPPLSPIVYILFSFRFPYLIVSTKRPLRDTLHSTGVHHIQVNINNASIKIVSFLCGRFLIAILTKCSLSGFPLIVLLTDPICNELY